MSVSNREHFTATIFPNNFQPRPDSLVNRIKAYFRQVEIKENNKITDEVCADRVNGYNPNEILASWFQTRHDHADHVVLTNSNPSGNIVELIFDPRKNGELSPLNRTVVTLRTNVDGTINSSKVINEADKVNPDPLLVLFPNDLVIRRIFLYEYFQRIP